MSSPATSARIARLEQLKVIKGYTIKEDERKLGYPIKAIINVEIDRKGREEIFPFIEQNVNVAECNYVTGEFCMVLIVYFQDTQKLDLFIGQIQQKGGNTKTQIVFTTPIERRGIKVN